MIKSKLCIILQKSKFKIKLTMNKILPFIYLSIFSVCLNSQNIVIDFEDDDRGMEVIQLSNGNYVIGVSETNPIALVDANIYIISPEGEVIWTGTEMIKNLLSSKPYRQLQPTTDGNFLLLTGFYRDVVVLKISSDGEILSDAREACDDFNIFKRSYKIKDGYIGIFSGKTNNDTLFPPIIPVSAIGFNEDGEITFKKRFEDLDRGADVDVTDLQYHEQSQSYYLSWFYFDRSDNLRKRNISKYDKDFNFLWTKLIGKNSTFIGSLSFTFRNDDEILFSFPNENDLSIIYITDLDLNVRNEIPLNPSRQYYIFESILHKGNIYFSGAAEDDPDKYPRFYMMGINNKNEIIMDTLWGKGGSYIQRMIKNNDNELILAGTIADGCMDPSTIQDCQDFYMVNFDQYLGQNIISSSDIIQNISTLEVFPNPSTGIFKIKNQELNNKYKSIEIYSTSMKLIKSVNGDTSGIDLTDYPNGIYYLKVTDKSNNYKTIKLIKQD